MGELKHYSSGKTFYKSLQNEQLTFDNIPNLFALMTHISIGLRDRVQVRDNVKFGAYLELKQVVDSLVSGILKDGEVSNKLKNLIQ